MSLWTVFRLRWLLWALGVAIVAAAALVRISPRLHARLDTARQSIDTAIDKKFGWVALLTCTAWGLGAAYAKLSQLEAGAMHSQDFWLFADALHSTTTIGRGPFLSRFAPQALGWVQHGLVHPTWILATLVPASLALGPAVACALFGPVVLAAAGFFFMLAARRNWQSAAAGLVVGLAFLFSSSAGKVLSYDVHPEMAYPLFFALWAYWFSPDPHRVDWRGNGLLIATIGFVLTKEEALLWILPLAILSGPAAFKHRTLALMLGVAVPYYSFRFFQSWKPDLAGVTMPTPGVYLSGATREATDTLAKLKAFAMPLLEVPESLGILKPFVGIAALAPWVFGSSYGRVVFLIPLAGYAALGGLPASLILYYGAGFVGLLFALAAVKPPSPERRRQALAWLAIASCLIGSGGIEVYSATDTGRVVIAQAQRADRCLERLKVRAESGFVHSVILPHAGFSQTATDRLPKDRSELQRIGFALFAPDYPTFELPAADLQVWKALVRTSPGWTNIDLETCEARSVGEPSGPIEFWIRSS